MHRQISYCCNTVFSQKKGAQTGVREGEIRGIALLQNTQSNVISSRHCGLNTLY